MKQYHTYRCGACGFIAHSFPSGWDDEQQQFACHCPNCGEDEKIELLRDGRGRDLSTIPADAMDQLMKQLPSGWFFPRKRVSACGGWHNKAAKYPKSDVKRLGRAVKRIMKYLDPNGELEDD